MTSIVHLQLQWPVPATAPKWPKKWPPKSPSKVVRHWMQWLLWNVHWRFCPWSFWRLWGLDKDKDQHRKVSKCGKDRRVTMFDMFGFWRPSHYSHLHCSRTVSYRICFDHLPWRFSANGPGWRAARARALLSELSQKHTKQTDLKKLTKETAGPNRFQTQNRKNQPMNHMNHANPEHKYQEITKRKETSYIMIITIY